MCRYEKECDYVKIPDKPLHSFKIRPETARRIQAKDSRERYDPDKYQDGDGQGAFARTVFLKINRQKYPGRESYLHDDPENEILSGDIRKEQAARNVERDKGNDEKRPLHEPYGNGPKVINHKLQYSPSSALCPTLHQ